jgi:hypothetical protein
MAFFRSVVIRVGGGPASLKPQRGVSGENTSPALIIIFNTMPFGESV